MDLTDRMMMLRAGPIVLAALVLAGCGGGPRFANENDTLRARVVELEREVAGLARRNDELSAALERHAARPGAPSAEVMAATPEVTAIRVGRLSHVRDLDGDGTVDTLVAYVTPRDGKGRFLQVVGELSVHVAVLPPDDDARTIGRITLDAADLRDAYRSGITGTHYTVEVPLEAPGPAAGPTECVVSATLEDARTGLRHTDQRTVQLAR